MLRATRWTLHEAASGAPTMTGPRGEKVALLRRFEFCHARMAMSVVVRHADGTLTAFVKGAPDRLQPLCEAGSLPRDFEARAAASALEGCYVLALACKQLPRMSAVEVEALTRDAVEVCLAQPRRQPQRRPSPPRP